MKWSFIIILSIVLTTFAACQKWPSVTSSPLAGNWKLDKLDVDTTNGSLNHLDWEEVAGIILVNMNEPRISTRFTDKLVIVSTAGDTHSDTSTYSLRQVSNNDYILSVYKDGAPEDMNIHLDNDKMEVHMKTLTYNFTRLSNN